jgi:large conductance mechanosensitive channel
VGIIIGAAFGAVVKSLVDDVLMPPVGMALGNVDFSNLFLVLKEGAKAASPYATLAEAKAAGAVTLNIGLFLNTIITFLIVSLAIFFVVRIANRMKPPAAAPVTTKDCPHCKMPIPIGATRCPQCTSELRAA